MSIASWREAVEKAESYKAVGQAEVWLDKRDLGEYPWEFATRCSAGGSHRFDMDTSVWFYAEHPSGLTFRWSFDLEPASANGTDSYQIDRTGVARVLGLLPAPAAVLFRDYLRESSKSVLRQANQYLDTAHRLYGDAAILGRLANHSESNEQ